MTDKEKLVEILESAESAFYWNSEDKGVIEKIADHLLANGVRLESKQATSDENNRWIPVFERLPEDDLPKDSKKKIIKVLVTYKTSNGVPVVRTNTRQKERWYKSEGWDWAVSDPITHWMPLPEPPKEENNA